MLKLTDDAFMAEHYECFVKTTLELCFKSSVTSRINVQIL